MIKYILNLKNKTEKGMQQNKLTDIEKLLITSEESQEERGQFGGI